MQTKNHLRHQLPVLLLGTLLLLVFLLSACGTPAFSQSAPIFEPRITHQDAAQLQSFRHWISVMQQSGGNVTLYQKQYNADRQALATARTDAAYKAAEKTLKAHIDAIQIPALQAEITHLRQQLQQKVASWGAQHKYYDSYDGVTYTLGYEYGPTGADGLVEDDLNAAQTVADYQAIVDSLNGYLANFDTMTINASDKTPYDKMHKTDLQLLAHYHVTGKKVVVVSLQEQAVRIYENGKLVQAFLATTGRPTHPSLPGTWQVEVMQSPTVFKSGAPIGSEDYYPDTKINYAMQYHSSGYFLHDSWWRANYGPGTNFPHQDATGNQSASTGSHGCVNLSTEDASWLYNFVELSTPVIVY